MNQNNTVLVVGSAGRIGQAVVAELRRRKLPVRGFDIVKTAGVDDCVVGDITRPEELQRAADGAGTLIHLAATPDDDDFPTKLLPNNIVGVYQVMEAARLGGVRRLVLASSGQVNWWQRAAGKLPVRVEDPPSPRCWYAATKMFLEAIGRGYAETHGISVIVARLGWCPRTPEQVQEITASEWAQDRKSTRLNSSHSQISYAVFCLKKKNNSRCEVLQARVQALVFGMYVVNNFN